jgi:hypothetical protein
LDWSRPNIELALVTGRSRGQVGQMRKRLGKPMVDGGGFGLFRRINNAKRK